MPRLGEVVSRVRSKNAGPFVVTVDVFCGNRMTYDLVNRELSRRRVGRLFDVEAGSVLRFELPEILVLKFSLPRHHVQGSRLDRDMHGAQWAVLLAESEIAGFDIEERSRDRA